jgi:hypothetical protein
VRSEEEALRPVIEAVGGEVAEYYAGVQGGVMFMENIDLLIFSTPVRCLVVSERVVDVSEESGESDKHPGSNSLLSYQTWCGRILLAA